ncbi:putative Protein kinase C-binding protein 1 [Hypsibius exemplaris]|uniref:Protein kinase C-binding protein 1 n=1 Tax=Hypsibius exemplaris TaxID=2072580 RepID=A0A1W0X6S6_HYPEX|nr:putative Protein kinase C-binding protein 1 [Hypsibius exemplaris]
MDADTTRHEMENTDPGRMFGEDAANSSTSATESEDPTRLVIDDGASENRSAAAAAVTIKCEEDALRDHSFQHVDGSSHLDGMDHDGDYHASPSSHQSVIVQLASFSGDSGAGGGKEQENSARSESVNSGGSGGDRDATASPQTSRRRSSRLRITERTSTRKSLEANENDEEPHLEGSDSADSKATLKGGKRAARNSVDYAMRSVAPERQMNTDLDVMWDGFCWRCHKAVPLAEQHGCPSCVRIFHAGCWWNDSQYNSKDATESHPVHAAFGHNLDRLPDEGDPALQDCIECFCILNEKKKEDSIFNRVGMEKFRKYLQYMMRFVDDHLPPERVRPFAVPVLEQDECSDSVKAKYAEYITHPMDLRQISQNIEEGKYNSWASFLADLRWIYHNTSIFNGQNNRYSRSASYIVETCQHLCYSLEWCLECFERGMPGNGESIHEAVERSMITPCSEPHAVVWVKAEKFPIWPAIVYRFNGAVADVRFFGAFEFGVFPKDAIFLFSKNAVTDRRKGRLKLDYENALRQFRLHVSKLRQIPGRELINYPRRTVYDGRLWMFPEGEDPSQAVSASAAAETESEQGSYPDHGDHTDDVEISTSTAAAIDDDGGSSAATTVVQPPSHQKYDDLISRSRAAREATNGGSSSGGNFTEKRSRSSSPSDEGGVWKRRHDRSVTPNAKLFALSESSDSIETPSSTAAEQDDAVVLADTAMEPVEAAPASSDAEEVHERSVLPFETVVTLTSEKSGIISPSLAFPGDDAEPAEPAAPEAVVEASSSRDSPKLDSATGSFPHTPTETVKPAFFESDSDTEVLEIPSFEMPEDADETRMVRPSGKLDHILKKPSPTATPSNSDQSGSSPSSGTGAAVSASMARNSALTQELNKSLSTPVSTLGGAVNSVLHDALVRPYQQASPSSEAFTSLGNRRPKPQSMVPGGQSHLIEALRASPRPSGGGGGSDLGQRRPDSGASAGDSERPSVGRREETLESLLSAGTQQRREFGRPSVTVPFSGQQRQGDLAGLPLTISGNRQILPKPESVPVQDIVRSNAPQQDRRRIDAVSNQLNNMAAARNAQARSSQIVSDGNAGTMQHQASPNADSNMNRSILARSLNAPSLNTGRHQMPLNGTSSSQGLRNGVSELNGDRNSPSAIQTAMRSLVTARSTHSPVAQDSLRHAPATVAGQQPQRRLAEGPIPSSVETVQGQIDLFLRNTRKIVKDKREETAQVIRESNQAHADNLRLLHEAQLKSQQRTEKMIQELHETTEQNIRKFELLFMVFHNESEFAQKSKILEVSRMKDLERQRAVTSAKRTLWCCVCQKRARLICCGVTMYCSEGCHLNNASLHRLHCRRLNSSGEDNGNVYTPYGVLVRCSLLPPGLDDEEDDLEGGIADGGSDLGAGSSAGGSHNYLSSNGWNNGSGRSSSDPVEVIDVQDEDNMEE